MLRVVRQFVEGTSGRQRERLSEIFRVDDPSITV